MAPITESAPNDPRSLQEFMFELLGDQLKHDSCYQDGKQQLAANLAYLTRHHITHQNIDRTRFELLLSKRVRTEEWRLVLLYDDEIVVRGQGGEREIVLEMMVEAAAEQVARLLGD